MMRKFVASLLIGVVLALTAGCRHEEPLKFRQFGVHAVVTGQ